MKAEAILYISEGVDPVIVAKLVDRTLKTVQGWIADWQETRLCSVVTGHAGNQNAAKLTREQKMSLREVLAAAPSEAGVSAAFWDVPALADVVKTRFDVVYESDSSYQLLLRFCGMSFKLPDPVDKRRDEAAITTRMAEIAGQVVTFEASGSVADVENVGVAVEVQRVPLNVREAETEGYCGCCRCGVVGEREIRHP
ncbi:winged helix-turn-helix domain-containing protein [Micropruina sp.]|uniref:winged helix-turn-helix domain-containing protein n=1 Tax=Micropruina sp. TaxID=2737536 RepID=UPI0039E460C6